MHRRLYNTVSHTLEELKALAGIGLMQVHELLARIDKGDSPRLIDVREDWEFQRGHIEGSELLPLSRFMDSYHQIPKDQELVIVCESGNRSGRAAQFLSGQGYGSVHNLVGGMSAWRRSGSSR